MRVTDAPVAVPAAPARPGLVLLGCVAGFVLGEVVAAVLLALGAALAHYPGGAGALAKAATPPWWANALSLVGLWSGFAGAFLFAARPGGLAHVEGQWGLRGRDVSFLGLGVLCQIAVGLLYAPFHLHDLGRPVHRLFNGSSGVTLALLGVMTVLLAPFVEELFFRATLYRALRRSLAGRSRALAVGLAALGSAVLFALAHGEPLQFAGLALVGLVLALVVEFTGRLWPAVLTHVGFNGVAYAVLVAQRVHG